MDRTLLEKLFREQLLSEAEFNNLQQPQPTVLQWDLQVLLYLGITLLTTALGILVYKNIDTIGHGVMITLIAVAGVACFIYCFRKGSGYTKGKVASPHILFDYILLLGCLLLITFIGYLQFQYQVFGNRWGLATFIPMVLLFGAAYYFDHIGVLSLAITNLAAWVGIAATPLEILKENDFSNTATIYKGLLLGTALVSFAFISVRQAIKNHFAFTYKNFGVHILFISLLAALVSFNHTYLGWFVVLAAASVFFFRNAIQERSFYFLVITVLYSWFGLSITLTELLFNLQSDSSILYLLFLYYIGSGIGMIRLLTRYNKILKQHANL